MTATAAVAACCCCSSSSSSVFAGRGRGGRVVAAASSSIAIKPSRVPRVRALSRLQLHSVDARRSHRLYEAASQGSKADRGAPMRAAVGGDGKGEGDDSTTTTPPSTSSSSPSSSQTAQEQRDLDLIRRAQANDAGTTYPLEEAKRLVDTAMLSAIGGLAYVLGSVLRLQAYMGYLLPMPVVVAGGRWGASATWQTAAATSLLVLVLLGPVQSLTYALNYGWPSAALGSSWARRLPWQFALAFGVLARVAGVSGYVALTSWTLGEDLLQLLLSNVCALLDQLATLLGTSAGSPPPAAVAATLAAVLAVNSAAHVAVLHLLYSALLRAVGLRAPPMPAWVARRVGVSESGGSGVGGGAGGDPLSTR